MSSYVKLLISVAILIDLYSCDPQFRCEIVNGNDVPIEVILSSHDQSKYIAVRKEDTTDTLGIVLRDDSNLQYHLQSIDTSIYQIKENHDYLRVIRSDTFYLPPGDGVYVGSGLGLATRCSSTYNYDFFECRTADGERTLMLKENAYNDSFRGKYHGIFEVEFY